MSEMTRRDHYICAALTGFLSNPTVRRTDKSPDMTDDVAFGTAAAAVADAALAAAGEKDALEVANDQVSALMEQVAHYMAEGQDLRGEIARLRAELENQKNEAHTLLVQYRELFEQGDAAIKQNVELRAELDRYKRPLTDEQADIVSEQVRIEDDDPRHDVDLMREIDAALRKVRSGEGE